MVTRPSPLIQLFTLEVALLSGPVSDHFARDNPRVMRTIEIRGNQTLAQLHRAIFTAFDREDEHLYEFQVGGRRPMDRRARRYGLPDPDGFGFGESDVVISAPRTRLDALDLQAGDTFLYWFDFGDDWWHEVRVAGITGIVPARGRYPRVLARVGESPPQYPDSEEEE